MMTDGPDERWWHDLRNALGNTSAALMVAEAELDDEHIGIAREFMHEARMECDAAMALLRDLQD